MRCIHTLDHRGSLDPIHGQREPLSRVVDPHIPLDLCGVEANYHVAPVPLPILPHDREVVAVDLSGNENAGVIVSERKR